MGTQIRCTLILISPHINPCIHIFIYVEDNMKSTDNKKILLKIYNVY